MQWDKEKKGKGKQAEYTEAGTGKQEEMTGNN